MVKGYKHFLHFWTRFAQLFSRNVISVTVSPEVCECVLHKSFSGTNDYNNCFFFTNLRGKLMYIINCAEVEFLYLFNVLLLCLYICTYVCVCMKLFLMPCC